MEFTHFNDQGQAWMVDVGRKADTARVAVAKGCILMSQECLSMICSSTVQKGDVLGVARVAGIMGAKKTSELIPLCHPLSLNKLSIEFTINKDAGQIEAVCTAATTGPTGVEMEALTGVSAALLTIYDMCKAVDKRMEISNICLLEKTGGKSGDFKR